MSTRLLALQKRFSGLVSVLTSAALLALLPLSSQAQQTPPQVPAWLSVLIVHVKSGQGPQFEDLVKKITMASNKANRPPVQVFQVVNGEQGVYHIVSTHQALAENDNPLPPPMKPEDMANIINRLLPTTDSARSFTARTYPQYSMLDANGAPPKLEILRTTRVVATRGDDYVKWLERYLMPALKEAKVSNFVLSRGFLGDSPQNFYLTVPVANWAEFDQPDPVGAALGQAATDRLRGIVESTEITLVRPRPDLANPTE